MSEFSPTCPAGIYRFMRSSSSLGELPESINPGDIVFTVMPCGANILANDLAKVIIPDLAI